MMMTTKTTLSSPPPPLPLTLRFPEVLMADHISTLKLHQLRYGELNETEVSAIQDHLRRCERCASRLQVQENQRAAFVLEPVPVAIRGLSAAPSLGERLQRWLRQPLLLGGLALAASALLAVVVAFPDGDGIRSKGSGDTRVEVVVENFGALDETVDPIRPGDRLQLRIPPGDWVQVWVGDEERWLGSFPVDPEKGRTRRLLPFSLEVDDQPGPEEIVIVLTNHPLTEQEANAALAGQRLGGVEVQTLQLRKEL